MKSGIYSIRNRLTGDRYVGSAKSILERWRRHRKDLRNGKHHAPFLLRSWRKYGEDVFEFEVLECCAPELLCARENHFLQLLKPSFNNCPTAYSQIGRRLTEDHKDKLRSFARKNGIKPPESTWKLKMRAVEMLEPMTREVIGEFQSLSDACRFIERTHRFASTIASCCNGGRHKTFLGRAWRWKTKEENAHN